MNIESIVCFFDHVLVAYLVLALVLIWVTAYVAGWTQTLSLVWSVFCRLKLARFALNVRRSLERIEKRESTATRLAKYGEAIE